MKKYYCDKCGKEMQKLLYEIHYCHDGYHTIPTNDLCADCYLALELKE